MNTVDNYHYTNQRVTFLDSTINDALILCLKKAVLMDGESILGVEKPGEGNMNFVLRVVTNKRSFILKQSRPFVQKYPHIAAPIERITVETSFYRLIEIHSNLTQFMPNVIAVDEGNYLLFLEDLGPAVDYTTLYTPNENISFSDLQTLITFLNHLHAIEHYDFPANMDMRHLNHAHYIPHSVYGKQWIGP